MLTRWLRNLNFDASDHAPEDGNMITHSRVGCDHHTSIRVVEMLTDRLLELTVSNRQQQDEARDVPDDQSHGGIGPAISTVIDSHIEVEEKEGDLRIISLEEVGQHADQDDAWMVIYDKVRILCE